MTDTPSTSRSSIAATVVRELAAAEHAAAAHIPHPHLARRAAAGPVKAADHLPAGSPLARFNTWLGVRITSAVGTMQCAYLFAALALISLPAAIRGGSSTLVSWTAQTFLQLVLLSIIMVGQNVQTAAGDARARATYEDGEAILHYADGHARSLAELHQKLDDVLAAIHAKLDKLPAAAAELKLPAQALLSEQTVLGEHALVGLAEKIGQKLAPKTTEPEPGPAATSTTAVPEPATPPLAGPTAAAPEPTPPAAAPPPTDGPAGSASTP